MRLTLYLISSRDFSLFIAALKRSSLSALTRILARRHITPDDVAAMNDLVMDALRDGPLAPHDLRARARARAGTRLRVWLDHAWVAFRPAIVEGLICYGPPRGSEATFVRVDHWLPGQPAIDDDRAVRSRIGKEAEALSRFFGTPCEVTIGS